MFITKLACRIQTLFSYSAKKQIQKHLTQMKKKYIRAIMKHVSILR